MGKSTTPIRIDNNGKSFLDRLIRNRIKNDTDLKGLTYGKALDLLYLFFKKYDESYKILLKMEYKKDA